MRSVLFHTAPYRRLRDRPARGKAAASHSDQRRPSRNGLAEASAVVPAERANTEDPASVSHPLKATLQKLESQPGVLTAGLATVQPWLDIPELGTAVVVVMDRDAVAATNACRKISDEFWRCRREYLPALVPLAEAVQRATERRRLDGPVGFGGFHHQRRPGDSTWLLAECLKYQWQRPVLIPLVAPEIVEQAERLGPGREFRGEVGAYATGAFRAPSQWWPASSDCSMPALSCRGIWLAICRSIWAARPCYAAGNVHLVVTSRSGPHFAPQLFQAAGLDPFTAQLLVAKSPCGFRAAYAKIAREIMVVAAPGCAPADFWKYDYARIPRTALAVGRDSRLARGTERRAGAWAGQATALGSCGAPRYPAR